MVVPLQLLASFSAMKKRERGERETCIELSDKAIFISKGLYKMNP
jgi:hypothetical protein